MSSTPTQRVEAVRPRPLVERALVVGIAILAAAAVAGAAAFLQRAGTQTLQEWDIRLGGVAVDRQQLVENWLDERRDDAALVATFPSVLSLLQRARRQSDTPSLPHLLEVLSSLVAKADYTALFVLDASGEVVAGIGDADMAARFAPGEVAVLDRDGAAPLVGVRVGVADPHDPQVSLGTILVVVDAGVALWPLLLESAPTSSAETVILRRENGDSLYLSPRRFAVAGASSALAREDLAGAAALEGGEQLGRYRDYRGVGVLTATRPIRGTPWALLRKVDESEAFEEYRDTLLHVFLLATVLAGLFAAIVVETSRRHRMRGLEAEVAHERSLRGERERYRSLSENANDLVLFVDGKGRIVDANRAAERAYGYKRGELEGVSIHDLVAADSPTRQRPDLVEAMAKGLVFESEHRRRDGSVFPVEASTASTTIDGEKLLLAVVRDISERRRDEARIQHLLGVIRAARDVSQMLAREGDRSQILQRACDILMSARAYRFVWIGEPHQNDWRIRPAAASGAPREALSSIVVTWDDSRTGSGPTGTALRTRRPVAVRSFDDERMEAWRDAARQLGIGSAAAMPIIYQDNVYGVLSVYAADADIFDVDEMALLEDLAGDLAYGLHGLQVEAEAQHTLQRLGESEAKYRQLSNQLERLVEERTASIEVANRELESFNYSVSHDLRAPLRHIQGFIQVLLEDYGPQISGEMGQLLDRVAAGSRRMGELVDALLQLSRVGRVQIQRRPVDLASIARAAFDELRPPSHVEFTVARDLPAANGDPLLLRQVFDNLIGNALKFTQHNAAPRIEVGALGDDGETVYFVRDNGVGFDPRYADKLFGVFQRLHSQSEFEGTGIGLSLVARIVHRHGGSVRAESVPGEGAVFFFTLPTPDADKLRSAA